jgi:hypothetical protein
VRLPARIALLVSAAALAGCGAERVPVPDPERPYASGGLVGREFPQAGVRFIAPESWTFDLGAAPLVASTSSGTVTIALWRYPRTEALPRDDAALEAAEQALQDAAERRDPSLRLDDARPVEVDGAPGIELTGTQRVRGRERRVRSTHVYAKGAEIVVDQSAAAQDFPPADRNVFRPLVDSMKIDPPQA